MNEGPDCPRPWVHENSAEGEERNCGHVRCPYPEWPDPETRAHDHACCPPDDCCGGPCAAHPCWDLTT